MSKEVKMQHKRDSALWLDKMVLFDVENERSAIQTKLNSFKTEMPRGLGDQLRNASRDLLADDSESD